MKRSAAAAVILLLASACAHTAIKRVGDCDKVVAEQRIECAACTVKNAAGGWIGDYEYRPDNAASDRCVRVH